MQYILFYVAIWIFKPSGVDGVIQESYNFKLKDSYHYTIDEGINKEDIEMVNKDAVVDLDMEHESKMFEELNKLARREYEEKTNLDEAHFNWFKSFPDYDDGILSNEINAQTSHSPRKRDVSNIDTDYDYNQLLYEYHMETMIEDSSNKTYHIDQNDAKTGFSYAIQKILEIHRRCSDNDISFRAIRCIFEDYRQQQNQPLKVLLWRCWKIIGIWIFVYITIAIPLWCTRGLCCCCLCCEFFKPHQSIDKAKKYFIMNPPGLMNTTKGHEILYEPTRRERDSYEEFEHLIRTI